MVTKFDNIEKVVNNYTSKSLESLTRLYGVDVIVRRPFKSTVHDVLGDKLNKVVVESANAAPFIFTTGVDDQLDIDINKTGQQSITFTAGTNYIFNVVDSINAIISGLASSSADGKLLLETAKSIDIKATSTCLTVLGLTSALTVNEFLANVIITGSEFTPSSPAHVSTLEEGILYDSTGLINTGDIVEVQRDDNKSRQFKVLELESIGSTQQVMNRFNISAILN